jgi:hypothetical protein
MALTTYLQNTSTYLKNGATQDVSGVQFPQQVGVPVQSLYMFTVVPVAANASCISPANAWIQGGQPLNANMQGTAPDISATPIVINGQKGLLLDCERRVLITLNTGQSGDNMNPVILTGYDRYLKPVITYFNLPVPTGSGPQTFTFPNPVLIVTSVVFTDSFGDGVTASIGTTDQIGLPYYSRSNSFIIQSTWNESVISTSAATVGYPWRNGQTSTTIVSQGGVSSTGPTRGYITTPTATNGTAKLTCCYLVYGSDREMNSELNVLNQSSLKVANVQPNTTTDASVLPSIEEYDLTGVVYPADIKFINAYKKLLS